MWQSGRLPKQIRPWDTLACCWDTKQPTKTTTITTTTTEELSLHAEAFVVGASKTKADNLKAHEASNEHARLINSLKKVMETPAGKKPETLCFRIMHVISTQFCG